MGYISDIYKVKATTPLLTDCYHGTTGQVFLEEGRANNPSISYMYGRKEAEGGGYTVSMGLEGYIEILLRWQKYGINKSDIKKLREKGHSEEEIEYLKKAEFKIQVDAIPEGDLFFPQEPLIRLMGPNAQVKALESVGLSNENGHCGWGSHAARMNQVLTAEVESGALKAVASVQGLRRGPAVGAALEGARSLLAGGYTSTSTGVAARDLGASYAGTMDHYFVMAHENQLGDIPLKELFRMRDEGRTAELQAARCKDAFRSYAMTWPDNGIYLTDTYDTLQGIEDAITVIKELRELGYGKNCGVRFDSEDLTGYSKIALRRFAEEGLLDAMLEFPDCPPVNMGAWLKATADGMSNKQLLQIARQSEDPASCAFSDGMDVYTAQEARRNGAYFKSVGVGTAGSHVPPMGLVQKLSAIYMDPLNGAPMPEGAKMTPRMKIVAGGRAKSSNPGKLNSRRFYGADGKLSHVVIYDEDLGFDSQAQMVNIRDFSDKKTNAGGMKYEDMLKPVFDAEGRYVYKHAPPKKPDFPGSRRKVTDLSAITARLSKNLEAMPADVLRVERPRNEVLKAKLLEAFMSAQKSGKKAVTIDIAAIEQTLPPPQAHIPVYFDALLYAQRVACEERHASKTQPRATGVAAYTERFER